MSAKKKEGTEAVHAGGRGLSLSILLLGCLFSFLLCERVAIAEEKDVSNRRFNIVFVLDGSESMTYNDPNGLRFDAISTIATLLVGQENKNSGFVFNEEPLDSVDLPPLNVSEDIEEFTNRFSEHEPSGDTDIGKAISKALEILEDEQQNLTPLVVLISDGTTDLPYATDEEREESRGIEKDAEDCASERGVKFLCVCIDTDNQHDSPELKEISEVTNGTTVYLNNKDDLPEVLDAFFNLLYETYLTPLKTKRVSGGFKYTEYGRLKTEFEYPAIGASEIMLVINGKVDESEFLGPEPESKHAYPFEAHYDDITLYRVREEDAGLWRLRLKGKPNTKITIKKAVIPKIAIHIRILPPRSGKEKNEYNPTDDIIVQSELDHADGIPASSMDYQKFEAELCVRSLQVAGEDDKERLIKMEEDESCFKKHLSLPEGKYALEVRVYGNGAEYKSEVSSPLVVSASTTPESVRRNEEPKLRFGKKQIRCSAIIWNPFKECPFDIDFSMLFYDREDSILSYSVGSSDYAPDNFCLINGVIKIKDINAGSGEFKITAVDSVGAKCSASILVETHSYTMGIVVFCMIILGTYVYYRVYDYDPGIEITVVEDLNKHKSTTIKCIGHLYLKEFKLKDTGIDYDKSYIFARNKSDVVARIYQLDDKKHSDTKKLYVDVRLLADNKCSRISNRKGENCLQISFRSIPKLHKPEPPKKHYTKKFWKLMHNSK